MKFTSVVEIFGAATAAFGGVEGIKGLWRWWSHRKQEKRKAVAEADSAEVNAEKALRDMYEETLSEMRSEYTERINELHASIDDANRRNHDLLTAGAKKDDIIEDKTAKIRELNDTIYKLQRRIMAKDNFIASLKHFIEWLKIWHCEREYPQDGMSPEELDECCLRRKPAQKVPVRYAAFREINEKDFDDKSPSPHD